MAYYFRSIRWCILNVHDASNFQWTSACSACIVLSPFRKELLMHSFFQGVYWLSTLKCLLCIPITLYELESAEKFCEYKLQAGYSSGDTELQRKFISHIKSTRDCIYNHMCNSCKNYWGSQPGVTYQRKQVMSTTGGITSCHKQCVVKTLTNTLV